VQNGTTICGGHHAAAHEGLIEITGPAHAIKVRWLIPAGTPPEVEEMRKMLLERELDELVSPSRHVPRGTPAPAVEAVVAPRALEVRSTAAALERLSSQVDALERWIAKPAGKESEVPLINHPQC
jgi:hypothetical protein